MDKYFLKISIIYRFKKTLTFRSEILNMLEIRKPFRDYNETCSPLSKWALWQIEGRNLEEVLVYQPLLCCFPGSGILPKSRQGMDMARSPRGDEFCWM